MHLYHLGCLLYDNQPENAIKAWEESRRHDDQFALVHRNLGLAYAQHEKDIARAIASLEKAVELAPTEPRFFYELDVQYEAVGAPVDERLAALSGHHDAVTQRDDALTREIVVLLATGQLDRAIEILTTHRFHNWEGSREIRDIYVDAMLLRGLAQLRAGRHDAALKDYQAAALFPANLEVGRPKRDSRAAQIDYSIGTAHEAVGDRNQAREFYTKAVEARDTGDFEAKYYQGMARQKLGQTAEAGPLFEAVLKRGLDQQAGESRDYFAKFGEKRSERVRKAEAHYLAGLGHLGLGRKAEAQTEFKKALELHPGHVWAAAHLAP